MDLHSPQPESNDIKNSCSVVPTRIRQIFSHKFPINHLAILVLRFDLHALISLMLQSLMKKIVGTTHPIFHQQVTELVTCNKFVSPRFLCNNVPRYQCCCFKTEARMRKLSTK